jgi:hypothetical protein
MPEISKESVRKILQNVIGLSDDQIERYFISEEYRPSVGEIAVQTLGHVLANRNFTPKEAVDISFRAARLMRKELDSIKVE